MMYLKKLLRPFFKPYFAWREARAHIVRNAQFRAEDQSRVDFYSQFVGKGELVFDVGANVGNRVRAFLALDARVLAIEPQRACAKILRSSFGAQNGFKLCAKGVSTAEGEAEIYISNVNTISSFSEGWIQAVKKSGRFSEFNWSRKQKVEMTTLDRLIESYGLPSFIKIDVEGFEFEVVGGLSQPVDCVSIEFTPEYFQNTLNCIMHMDKLHEGNCSYQLSLGESMVFELPEWCDRAGIEKALNSYRKSSGLFGDIYIRKG
ncbi:MAG: FkbM family methyltransferase [bacterium]|nr:FkbM family methyltransferase [bacterium]